MKKDLRGVAIGGCCAGDVIVLYTKEKKLKYEWSDDYVDEGIKAMFIGIERFQPPKKGGSKSGKEDWRTGMQKESMRMVMGSIGVMLNVFGVASCLVTWWFGRLSVMWSAICLLVMVISTVLYFMYPQYFSIMGGKEYKRVGYTAKVIHLHEAILLPAGALAIRGLSDYCILNPLRLLIMSVVFGIGITIIMHIFSREVKENTSFAVGVLLLSVLVSSGLVGQLNHFANFSANEPQRCTVIEPEKDKTSRYNYQYDCTVEIGSGSEIEIPISRSVYNDIHPGDEITVYTGQGALGIEYAYYVDRE